MSTLCRHASFALLLASSLVAGCDGGGEGAASDGALASEDAATATDATGPVGDASATGGDASSPGQDAAPPTPDAAPPDDDAGAAPADAAAPPADASAPPSDAGLGPSDASPADGGLPPPNLREALDCAERPRFGAGNSTELQRHEVDTTTFPDALCNDGSPAALYFRPYVGEENRDRWVIQLRGGGSCATGDDCIARWCGCTGPRVCPFATTETNFDIGNMIGDGAGSQNGGGIMKRGDPTRPNPLGDYNQVRLTYCSSDGWTGTRRDVPFEAVEPKTGAPVEFSMHFLGNRILEADLRILRQDGVAALVHTLSGAETPLPDLDDAVEVIVAGDSAGGAGVISNLDRVATTLRDHNARCAPGGECPLVVRGLMDAVVGPDYAPLDFTTSAEFERGLDSYETFIRYLKQVPSANRGSVADESCVAWHEAQGGLSSDACSDIMHVVRHHLSTPFFVRMALGDVLISGNYIELGASDPELGAMTIRTFALRLRQELGEFPNLAQTAEEGAAIETAPGVFAPACAKHDTLGDDAETFETTITPAGAGPLTLLEVFENWRNGDAPAAVLTTTPDLSDTQCPPRQ